MFKLAYLLFNYAIIGAIISMELHSKLFSRLDKARLMLAYGLVSLPYIVWDYWAVIEGHWSFYWKYVSGLYIGRLAIEEIIFFVSVPLVMLLVFGIVSQEFNKQLVNKKLARTVIILLGLLGAWLVLGWVDNGYTSAAGLALIICVSMLLAEGRLIYTKSFWVFQIISIVLFFAANSVLTSLPIIIYGDQAIIGTRIGTIPFEDFLYNFALINSFLVVYFSGQYKV